MRRARVLVAATAALAMALAGTGCGLALGPNSHTVRLRVTEDFGAHSLGGLTQSRVPTGETALSLLRRLDRSVRTVPVALGSTSSGIVSVAGHAARAPARWTLFVNGVHAARGAASVTI